MARPYHNPEDPYRVYATRGGKRDYVSFKSLAAARREAEINKKDRNYSKVVIQTKLGKTVSNAPKKRESTSFGGSFFGGRSFF